MIFRRFSPRAFVHRFLFLRGADSELIIKQVLGQYKCRKAELQPLNTKASRALSLRTPSSISHHASRLANDGENATVSSTAQAIALSKRFKRIEYKHIRREFNSVVRRRHS